MLILVEIGFLVSGFIIVGLVYVLIPFTVIRFIGASLGGFVSGYVYTAKTCEFLTKHKIIRDI